MDKKNRRNNIKKKSLKKDLLNEEKTFEIIESKEIEKGTDMTGHIGFISKISAQVDVLLEEVAKELGFEKLRLYPETKPLNLIKESEECFAEEQQPLFIKDEFTEIAEEDPKHQEVINVIPNREYPDFFDVHILDIGSIKRVYSIPKGAYHGQLRRLIIGPYRPDGTKVGKILNLNSFYRIIKNTAKNLDQLELPLEIKSTSHKRV